MREYTLPQTPERLGMAATHAKVHQSPFIAVIPPSQSTRMGDSSCHGLALHRGSMVTSQPITAFHGRRKERLRSMIREGVPLPRMQSRQVRFLVAAIRCGFDSLLRIPYGSHLPPMVEIHGVLLRQSIRRRKEARGAISQSGLMGR